MTVKEQLRDFTKMLFMSNQLFPEPYQKPEVSITGDVLLHISVKIQYLVDEQTRSNRNLIKTIGEDEQSRIEKVLNSIIERFYDGRFRVTTLIYAYYRPPRTNSKIIHFFVEFAGVFPVVA